MKNKIILLIFISSLFGCRNYNSESYINEENKAIKDISLHNCDNESEKYNFSQININDKFTNILEKDTSFEISEAQFSPLYIGDFKKDIILIYKTEKIGNRTYDLLDYDLYKRPDTSSIRIFIDTNRIIGSPMSVWEYYDKPEYRNSKIAYPVFISNISVDTLNIGLGNILPMVIEAKDENGNWKPIQNEFIYDCGTGLTIIYIAPNQITITSMKLFHGDFKTKLRLVFGYFNDKVYSNEIDGYINIEQFKE